MNAFVEFEGRKWARWWPDQYPDNTWTHRRFLHAIEAMGCVAVVNILSHDVNWIPDK